MSGDKLAAALDEIRQRHAIINQPCGEAGVVIGRMQLGAGDVLRLLAALDGMLKPHEPMMLYWDAENCDHPEPPPAKEGGDQDAYTEWDEWNDNHPYGAVGADRSRGDRICLYTEIGTACPECSALVYDVRDGNGFVDARECLVRPIITRALLGEDDR